MVWHFVEMHLFVFPPNLLDKKINGLSGCQGDDKAPGSHRAKTDEM